jgi:hypothetical protein
LLNHFRNKKIRRIFSRYPNIEWSEQGWLLSDLKVREERLRSDLPFHKTIERKLVEDRIVLIENAICILSTDTFKSSPEGYKTVEEVYNAILKGNKG